MDASIISKIDRIKDIGIFYDFKWSSEIPELRKYNLIYGWNGTGKTTLSNIFRMLEIGDNIQIGIATISLNSGTKISSDSIHQNPALPLIKVFNRNYVEDSIGNFSGDVAPIHAIGKDHVNLLSKIDENKKLVSDLDIIISEATRTKMIKKKELDKIREQKRDEIKSTLGGDPKKRYTNYNVNKVGETIKFLQDETTPFNEKYPVSQVQDLLKKINESRKDKVNLLEPVLGKVNEIVEKSEATLGVSVISETIERFNVNEKLQKWAHKGLELIEDDKKCPFCTEPLKPEYEEKLMRHFNEAYSEHINTIESLRADLKHLVDKDITNFAIKVLDKSRYYAHLSDAYTELSYKLKDIYNDTKDILEYYFNMLREKKGSPHLVLKPAKDFLKIEDEKNTIQSINELSIEHNEMSENHEKEIESARTQYEKVVLAQIVKEYLEIEESLALLDDHIRVKSKDKSEIESVTKDMEQKATGHAEAAIEINIVLENYLGHGELKLDAVKNGYRIRRNGEDVGNTLSEGEKTAIALTHFVRSLEDKDFDLSKGIVVIDDPVSSMDTNTLCAAFGYLKSKTNKAGQIVIMTHNYVFYKMVRRWFVGRDDSNRKQLYRLYILNNVKDSSERRTGKLQEIDPILKEYDSEYHYLFSILYKASKSESFPDTNIFNYPNLLRRFIETYGAFKYPNITSLTSIIEHLFKDDSATAERVSRFVHGYSHRGFVSDGTEPDITNHGETKILLKAVLDKIEILDTPQYDALVKMCSSPSNL